MQVTEDKKKSYVAVIPIKTFVKDNPLSLSEKSLRLISDSISQGCTHVGITKNEDIVAMSPEEIPDLFKVL